MSTKVDTRVEQYVRLRDRIKDMEDAHKAQIKPFKELLEKFNVELVQHLNSIGVESAATEFGTVYKTIKASATIADMSAFWTYVVTQGDFDMVDRKANKTRVQEYIEENGGQLPPGVSFSQIEQVGVRRKTGT